MTEYKIQALKYTLIWLFKTMIVALMLVLITLVANSLLPFMERGWIEFIMFISAYFVGVSSKTILKGK